MLDINILIFIDGIQLLQSRLSPDIHFKLLKNMHVFKILDLPLLSGISRTSMICKVLNISPKNALNGTTALHIIALQQGAKILRVHDVKEAMQTIKLWQQLEAI